MRILLIRQRKNKRTRLVKLLGLELFRPFFEQGNGQCAESTTELVVCEWAENAENSNALPTDGQADEPTNGPTELSIKSFFGTFLQIMELHNNIVAA